MIEMGSQVALVVALVALIRKYVPKVDGAVVLVVGAVVTALIVSASLVQDRFPMMLRGVQVLIGALGGTAFAQQMSDRHADAVGEAVGRASALPAPASPGFDATVTPIRSPLPVINQSDPPSDPRGAA